ncbi:hypothetical protein PR002_g33124 [Phytophthora rubi]|uniref:Uncharacterized protein n=1 Tax=Phytophthora rubi TaxID=129364 RepID=A0A6A3FXR8_9STRA|nr:hypothetical protein PR002_g33124 [Phytophthora rubi]
MSPSTVTFFCMGNWPLSTFMSDVLPDPGCPSTSVMVPGSNTASTRLSTCRSVTRLVAVSLRTTCLRLL